MQIGTTGNEYSAPLPCQYTNNYAHNLVVGGEGLTHIAFIFSTAEKIVYSDDECQFEKIGQEVTQSVNSTI